MYAPIMQHRSFHCFNNNYKRTLIKRAFIALIKSWIGTQYWQVIKAKSVGTSVVLMIATGFLTNVPSPFWRILMVHGADRWQEVGMYVDISRPSKYRTVFLILAAHRIADGFQQVYFKH